MRKLTEKQEHEKWLDLCAYTHREHRKLEAENKTLKAIIEVKHSRIMSLIEYIKKLEAKVKQLEDWKARAF